MTEHIITFDIGPGTNLGEPPAHRVVTFHVPENRLMANIEALSILNKRVMGIDIAPVVV